MHWSPASLRYYPLWQWCASPLPRPTHPWQVAYGLDETQMRRWGLYVSQPLGPEEAVTTFSGAVGQGEGQHCHWWEL